MRWKHLRRDRGPVRSNGAFRGPPRVRPDELPAIQDALGRILGGDPSGVGDLMERFRERLLPVADRMLRDHGAAEDALQEGALRLLEDPGRIPRNPQEVLDWVVLIVKGKARDLRKLRARQREHDRGAAPLRPSQAAPPPELKLAALEQRARLEARLRSSLRPAAAEVAVLHGLDGLALRACASRLGRSRSWAKGRWREARNVLSRLLEKPGGFRKKT